jgi:predicted RNA-binding Zn ribbon-like protein
MPALPTLPEDREGFRFRSDHVALDLAATLAARRTEPRELLATPADLDRWIRAAGLPSSTSPAMADDLRAARELREALYRLAQACRVGTLFAPADRALVNDWAARPLPPSQLGPMPGDGAAAGPLRVSQILTAIAREAVGLYSGAEAAKIRACEGCSILFVDSSRAGQRRWCSMAACGNKVKVAAHRKRRAGAPE